jgi:hypothetical protein
MLPVGLVTAFPAETLLAWTDAVSPTAPPTVMEAGVAVTVVVATPVPF